MRKLFERGQNGLLVEVDVGARGSRRVTTMPIQADILWTQEQEAARDAEEIASAEKQAARQSAIEQRRDAAVSKLMKIGLTPDDIKNILS